MRIPVFRASDQARHKPGCAVTEDNQRPEISNLDVEGLYYRKQRRRSASPCKKTTKNRPSHDDK